ncbi:MAG TPA: hypothetical protein VFE78_34215 [Gemmataceae bacterium]|nr:hypothetical protein [Gemmataceae bacterium]
MSYQVDVPDAERAYLDGLPLSPEAKQRVNRFIEQVLADIPDTFRLNHENRLGPGSPYFLARYLLLDRWGDGHMHTLDFHVRDDMAKFGVLLIVFIDHY